MSLGRTLVLNAASQPVEVCEAEEAIWDVMNKTAFVVEGTGKFCHSPTTEVEIPSVIQQYLWHAPKTPSGRPRSLPLTPRNVCARDRWKCAYEGNTWISGGHEIPSRCTSKATTIDHIVPRSKGGENVWESVAASCRSCNHFKGNRSLADLGWTLNIKPWRPTGALARVLVHSSGHEGWQKYLR